jgi:hypothetical protein
MDREARLQLTPTRAASEHFDGAWWPRSRRLVEELPALVASVSDRLGRVVLVGYRRNGWEETPPLVEIAGRTVELLSFASDEPTSVILIGDDGRHVTLRVVGPDTDAEVARQALEAARGSADAGTPAAGPAAVTRSVADIAEKLARHEGLDDERRTVQIRQWAQEAARQFVDAPLQTFVPILVEHIVRNRMIETRRRAEDAMPSSV